LAQGNLVKSRVLLTTRIKLVRSFFKETKTKQIIKAAIREKKKKAKLKVREIYPQKFISQKESSKSCEPEKYSKLGGHISLDKVLPRDTSYMFSVGPKYNSDRLARPFSSFSLSNCAVDFKKMASRCDNVFGYKIADCLQYFPEYKLVEPRRFKGVSYFSKSRGRDDDSNNGPFSKKKDEYNFEQLPSPRPNLYNY